MSKKIKENQWATELVPAVAGRDFVRQPNGVIVVGRHFSDLIEPYQACQIPNYFALADHELKLDKKGYKRQLDDAEREFNTLVREKLGPAKRFLIFELQGRDGAGKTGTRKTVEAAIDYDAKLFQTICVGPPSQEELQHGDLWRFFEGERMPRFGEIRVFDRTWHERVLVERVEELTPVERLQRSYAELRAFEWLLVQQGGILVKLWLDITKDEQKARFDERKRKKPWKYSDSDKIARKHWNQFTYAGNEMLFRTGTDFAPWNIVAGDDKRYSRVTALQLANQAMREQLG